MNVARALKNKTIVLVGVLLGTFFCVKTNQSQSHFPGAIWNKFRNPGTAGWDTAKLDEAQAYAKSIHSAAYMLIEDGTVVDHYGDISRRYMCHSVRKSLLSALYGIYFDKGKIDTAKTIAELGIDDKDSLTGTEKQAKIIDLLKARSGIYHPAAYETRGMAAMRPARGSHKAGTFWYYNNWDFNTLGYIFRQETGEDIFEAFKKELASPLNMQDYELHHGYYHLEAEHSHFPAYPFRMSARDLARIGLLFEREGKWNGRQIIPRNWINESYQSYSEVNNLPGGGYGYMWWVLGDDFDEYGGGYTALGVGGQTITILPEQDIVFVNRTNTYSRDRINTNIVMNLLKKLMESKTKEGTEKPEVVAVRQQENVNEHPISSDLIKKYAKNYSFPNGYSMEVKNEKGKLHIYDPGFGYFNLIPISDTSFLIEDALEKVFFIENDDSVMFVRERTMNQIGYYFLRKGETSQALHVLRLNTIYFPQSYNVFDSMGDAYLTANDTDNSIQAYKKSLNINPYNVTGIWALMQLKVDGYKQISLTNKDFEPFMGNYQLENQEFSVEAYKDSLFLRNLQVQQRMWLIPLSNTKFLVGRGGRFLLEFTKSPGQEYNGFNVFAVNGLIGKGRKEDH